jgi:hypothetical protein
LRKIVLLALVTLAAGAGKARAQQDIGATVEAQNNVSRELSGASGPLKAGDDVFRNELVRTGADSTAKLVFLDSTNLAIGPTSRVTLDEFVYSGESNGQKMTVNLAKGVFRFTTGALDKRAYEIGTPTAVLGVRGTVLDIEVREGESRVTLVEGQALACPRRPGITFDEQVRNCSSGAEGAHCDCFDLNIEGQTAQVRRIARGVNHAGLSSRPVNVHALCSGSVCSRTAYASVRPAGTRLASTRSTGGGKGGFPTGALCGR